MRNLCFEVDRQSIQKVGDFSGLVTGTSNYLRAVFVCSGEWKGCKKAASFFVGGKEYGKLIVDGACDIPPEAAGAAMFEVAVTGLCADGRKLKTGRAVVRQEGT